MNGPYVPLESVELQMNDGLTLNGVCDVPVYNGRRLKACDDSAKIERNQQNENITKANKSNLNHGMRERTKRKKEKFMRCKKPKKNFSEIRPIQ